MPVHMKCLDKPQASDESPLTPLGVTVAIVNIVSQAFNVGWNACGTAVELRQGGSGHDGG
jgi:hypothetical protein